MMIYQGFQFFSVSTSEDELNSNYPAPVPFSGAPIFRSDDSNDGSLVIPVPIPAFGNVAPIEGCSGKLSLLISI